MPSSSRLTRRFYRRDAVTLAKALLGQRMVHVLHGERLAGDIVETEAYLGVADRAAHTFGGRRTPRNETMWRDGGHLYVYFTYGMHHCANVVAATDGEPVAVLIRALEPTEGCDAMFARRPAARRPTDLCSGPAKLCAALDIDRRQDGLDLVESPTLWIEAKRQRRLPDRMIRTTPRVGIDSAGDWRDRPLRFCVADNPHVSKR